MLTVSGIAVAFFLSAAQVGLLVGWCNTTSAIIRHTRADIWVMARQTPAFDYGTAIPRNRVYQVRNIEGVEWAEGLFMAWNIWQRADGRRVNIELVGLDESCVGGPWRMKGGAVAAVHRPDTVIVDDLYLKALGVERVGQEFEMIGERAVVGGVSEEVRTFTASPYRLHVDRVRDPLRQALPRRRGDLRPRPLRRGLHARTGPRRHRPRRSQRRGPDVRASSPSGR